MCRHRNVGAADTFEPACEFFRQTSSVIHAADPRGEARQQGTGTNLPARETAGNRPEEVRRAEFAILARVQQGEFLAIADPGMERRRCEHFHRGVSWLLAHHTRQAVP